MLACGMDNGMVTVWMFPDPSHYKKKLKPQYVLRRQKAAVNFLKFHPKENILLTGGK